MSNPTPIVKINVLSIVGMILSILSLIPVIYFWDIWGSGLFLFVIAPPCGFLSLAGVICSHIAWTQIKTRGERGRWLALTGIICGWVAGGICLAVVAAEFLSFLQAFHLIG